MVAKFKSKQMRAARKHRPDWDEAFFLVRTDPERKPAVRRKPSKPLRLGLVPFDFEAARRTWEALGVEITEDRIREHLAELEQWQRWRRKPQRNLFYSNV